MRLYLLILGCLVLLGCSSCMRLFYQPSRKLVLHPQQLGLAYQNVVFRSADGTKLHGWFFPAQTAERRGAFVQFHGNAENISTHFVSLLWVIQHGYHFFTFDYRGYGQSGGAVSQQGMHEDVMAAIAQARALTATAGGERLILFGQSLGGTLLLRAMADVKDRRGIAALVADSAFGSYQAITREKLASHWLTFLLHPLASILVSDRHAPQRVLDKIAPLPLLIIHGSRDRIVPAWHGQQLYEHAQNPKWFWRLEGVGHIRSMAPEYPQHRQALLDFLDRLETPAIP